MLPQWYQDYMATAANRGLNLANLPFTPYSAEQRVSPLNSTQNAAINMIQQRATTGSPLTQNMQGFLGNTMSGNYLNSNPYMQQINQTAGGSYLNANPYMQQINQTAGGSYLNANPYMQQINQTAGGNYLNGNPYLDSIINKTQGDVQARMGQLGIGSGSFGNSGVMSTAARELADSSNQLRYQNYDAERQRQMQAQQMGAGIYDAERMRQMQAASMAPAASQADYYDANQLMNAGGMQRQVNQDINQSNYNEFLRGQQWPFQTQQAFVGSLGMNPGSTTTQQSPDQSKWATGLGAGATALWGLGGLQSLWNAW